MLLFGRGLHYSNPSNGRSRDIFDAKTSTRAYRKALPVSDAIAEIRRCSGTQLNPDIVLAFLACQPKIVMPGDVSFPKGFEDSFLALFRPRID